MPPLPREGQEFFSELPHLLSDIRVDMKEIKIEMRETLKRVQEHLERIDEVCPKHEMRIRNCEDRFLQLQTAAWVVRVIWGAIGAAIPIAAYLGSKFVPSVF